MGHYTRWYQHPQASITNHNLIKLSILWALERTNQTWEKFVVQAMIDHVPIEEEDGEEEYDNHTMSNEVGGSDGEAKEVENDQAGDLEEVITMEVSQSINPCNPV